MKSIVLYCSVEFNLRQRYVSDSCFNSLWMSSDSSSDPPQLERTSGSQIQSFPPELTRFSISVRFTSKQKSSAKSISGDAPESTALVPVIFSPKIRKSNLCYGVFLSGDVEVSLASAKLLMDLRRPSSFLASSIELVRLLSIRGGTPLVTAPDLGQCSCS